MSQLEVQFDGWNYILVGSFRMGMSGGNACHDMEAFTGGDISSWMPPVELPGMRG